jgi:peptidoglycan/xylan/chitin deacetylase (PgdA/CDA1 family)
MPASKPRRTRLRRFLFRLLFPIPVGAVVLLIQPHWVIDMLARAEPRILWQVDTAEPLAAMTFDDGPDADNTPKVLDVLKAHGAHATFFLIGGHARARPDLVARIRAEGHEVANHTHGDRPTFQQAEPEFEASVLEAERLLGLENVQPRFFRPASGLIRREQLEWVARQGYRCVLGSAYPYDPIQPAVPYMVWLVRKNLRPGAIVVLHEYGDRGRTLAALAQILDAGKDKGLRFVTLGDLWAHRKG